MQLELLFVFGSPTVKMLKWSNGRLVEWAFMADQPLKRYENLSNKKVLVTYKPLRIT